MVAYFMLGVWKLRDTRGGERRDMCRLRKEEEERERYICRVTWRAQRWKNRI